MPDYGASVASESTHVDEARSTLAMTDSTVHVVGMTAPRIEQLILDSSTNEVQRLLRDCDLASEGLRRLATEIDVAGNAIRAEAALAWDRHDKARAAERDIERPVRVPASATGGDDRGEANGPRRG